MQTSEEIRATNPVDSGRYIFTVWFFSGTTQRTRHILPIYPLILLVAFPAAIVERKAGLRSRRIGVLS